MTHKNPAGFCYECKKGFEEPKTIWRNTHGQKLPFLVPPCHPNAAWQYLDYCRSPEAIAERERLANLEE